METTQTTATVDQNKQLTGNFGAFGSGRYSQLMLTSYKDSKRLLKLDDEKADKLARQIGSDFGAAMRSAEVEGKTSRTANSEGRITLSEAAKVKNITSTNALTAMRVMQYMNEAPKFHINPSATEWKIAGEFGEWLSELWTAKLVPNPVDALNLGRRG